MNTNHQGDICSQDGPDPQHRRSAEAGGRRALGSGQSGSWPAKDGSVWFRYGMAILSIAVALVLDQADFLSGGFRIYLVFYPFIVLATLYGGIGPGLLATFLSCLAVAYFWAEPLGSFAVAARADLLSMAIFIGGNLFFIWICERLRRATRQAIQGEAYRERSEEMGRQAQILKESEQRLSLAQRAGKVGVFDWDILSRKVVWTPEQEELFGLPSGSFEQTYDGWAKRVHPEDEARLTPFFKEWIRSQFRQGNESWEYRIQHSDGQIRWIEAEGQIIRDAAGRAVRMIGTNRDVTTRHRAEEELSRREIERERLLQETRAAKELAENASQAKDQFIAALSHELRTPLTPVLATVTALKGQADLSAEIRTDLELVRRNVEMEAALINDLLDVTRINTRKIIMRPEVVDSQTCLQAALNVCQGDIEAKHLDLSLMLSANHPYVWADATRLQQVFWNLLRNAVKFTPEGGRISVRSSNDNGNLKVEIADTGIGISPEVLPRVFKAFEQGEKTSTRFFGGLGLGLSIAKAVVEMHHGSLTVFSEGQDRGATFTLKLATLPAGSENSTPPTDSTQHVERPLKILLVDDHIDTLQTMAKLLQRLGYSVTTATRVRDALDLAATERVDLILSDLGLPDGSGLDIMRQAKMLYALRGIAFSGYGTEEDIRQSREAGFAEHLVKPISFDTLRETIHRVVSSNA